VNTIDFCLALFTLDLGELCVWDIMPCIQN